jgi:hypothetical protein
LTLIRASVLIDLGGRRRRAAFSWIPHSSIESQVIVVDGVPPWVDAPFVLGTEREPDERNGNIDLYLPAAEGKSPGVVFVMGGPLPADLWWNKPRDWPVYRGYGGLLSSRGVVAALAQLPLHVYGDYPAAVTALAEAVEVVRANPRVDSDRIGIWFFCGGGPLLDGWLRNPPPWLRSLAASYPLLGSRPGKDLPPEVRPIEALAAEAALPPFVLTRVGLEEEELAVRVEEFVAAAEKHGVALDIVDVPHGHHGFEFLDYTEESRAAVHQALDLVLKALI